MTNYEQLILNSINLIKWFRFLFHLVPYLDHETEPFIYIKLGKQKGSEDLLHNFIV
jgi:hypothetical protein